MAGPAVGGAAHGRAPDRGPQARRRTPACATRRYNETVVERESRAVTKEFAVTLEELRAVTEGARRKLAAIRGHL